MIQEVQETIVLLSMSTSLWYKTKQGQLPVIQEGQESTSLICMVTILLRMEQEVPKTITARGARVNDL